MPVAGVVLPAILILVSLEVYCPPVHGETAEAKQVPVFRLARAVGTGRQAFFFEGTLEQVHGHLIDVGVIVNGGRQSPQIWYQVWQTCE